MLRFLLKVTICLKNVLPVETLQNHSQRLNTSYVLLKRVRTSQFKKIPEFMFLRDVILSFTGAVTAIITNPLWLVRVRMFTSRADSPTSYRGLWGESRVFGR